jgi:hypothetical protein
LRTSKNITPRNHSVMNMSRCWKSSAWNTTRDTFSKPARNDLPNMPLLTELEIGWVWFLQRCRAYGAGRRRRKYDGALFAMNVTVDGFA